MGVYDRQIAQVKRQITAKGEAVTWNVAAPVVVIDPAKPWITFSGGPVPKKVSRFG